MRIGIVALSLALMATAARAGEATYTGPGPNSYSHRDAAIAKMRDANVAACARTIDQAQDGLAGLDANKRSHAERFIAEARQAQKAGDTANCYARASDALRWE